LPLCSSPVVVRKWVNFAAMVASFVVEIMDVLKGRESSTRRPKGF
jgi:hypothetical protein